MSSPSQCPVLTNSITAICAQNRFQLKQLPHLLAVASVPVTLSVLWAKHDGRCSVLSKGIFLKGGWRRKGRNQIILNFSSFPYLGPSWCAEFEMNRIDTSWSILFLEGARFGEKCVVCLILGQSLTFGLTRLMAFLGCKSILANKPRNHHIRRTVPVSLLPTWSHLGPPWSLRSPEESAGREYHWYL